MIAAATIANWEPFALFLLGLFSGLSAGIFWATWDQKQR